MLNYRHFEAPSSTISKEKIVNLGKRTASVFSLKTQIINKIHFILCFSINKVMGKTLITTQQARGTTVGNRRFWVGRIKVAENTIQSKGTLWECRVLSGEHRLYNCRNYLNWGLHPSPLLGGGLSPTPLFLISLS